MGSLFHLPVRIQENTRQGTTNQISELAVRIQDAVFTLS